MITRDLKLKVGYTSAVLDQPLHLYMYDRNIKLRITIVNYDFRFGGNLNGNFIGENNIVKAKSFLRSPKGEIFEDPDVETDISNDIVEILIKNIMTDELAEIGEWSIQIKLFDTDGSTIHIHPFSFYVHELIGLTGNLDFDARNNDAPYDPKTPDSNIIKSSYLNELESKLGYVYSQDLLRDVFINEYMTDNKTTIGAINELLSKYNELSSDINKLKNGTLDIEQYKKDYNLKADTTPDKLGGNITDVEIINKSYNKINIGGYYLYKVAVEPKSMYSSRYKIIRWKSNDPNIAKVNDTGKVIGVSEGIATITAYNRYNEKVYDEFDVKIGKYVPLSGIIVPKPEFEIPLNDNITIPISFLPKDTTETAILWESSNTVVAKVDQYGKITGTGLGMSIITIKSLDKPKKSVSIRVVVKDTTEITKSVKIIPPEYTVCVDDVIEMKCDTNPIGQAVTWSCNSQNAVITEDGVLTILSEGEIDITCSLKSDPSISDTLRIVSQINYGTKPTKIILKDIPEIVAVGANYKFDYSVEPDGADDRLTWKSSNEKIAKIDDNGVLTVLGEGSVTITVTSVADSDVRFSFDLECLVTVSKIKISNPISELLCGESHPCYLKAEPAMPEGAKITWSSSDTNIATVDNNGIIKAERMGTVTITATVDGVSDSFVLKCKGTVPTSMDIIYPSFGITYTPVHSEYDCILRFDSVYSDTRVKWIFDETIVNIDDNGHLKALKPGGTLITVQSLANPSLKQEFIVNVQPRRPDKVCITSKVNTITLSSPSSKPTHQFGTEFYYSKDGDHYKSDYCIDSVKWELVGYRNDEIATINENGLLTVKGVGLITVKVTSTANPSAYEQIEVDCIVNGGIKINSTSSVLIYGTTTRFSLPYTISPSGYNVPVEIKISPNVSMTNWSNVGMAGYYTIETPGTYNITVTTLNRNSPSVSFTVVINRYITNLSLSPADAAINTSNITADYIELVIDYLPTNATSFGFTWETSDESIATVISGNSTDLRRRIQKISGGPVTITCTYIGKRDDISLKATIDLNFANDIKYKIKTGGNRSFRLNGKAVTGVVISEDIYNSTSTCVFPITDYINDVSFCDNEDLIEVLELNTSRVTDASDMFMNCTSLKSIPDLDISNVTKTGGVFKQIVGSNEPASYINPYYQITLLGDEEIIHKGMFANCTSLLSIPNLNTGNVTDMYRMFFNCSSITTIPELDTKKVANMGSMFALCTSLTHIPKLNTSNVRNMGGFTYYWSYDKKLYSSTCVYNSITIKPEYGLNPGLHSGTYVSLSRFVGSGGMFAHCHSLKSIPNLDTSNVVTMDGMFANCISLTSLPATLNTGKVVTMEAMFANCHSLAQIPNLDTTSVNNMNYIFYFCRSIKSNVPSYKFWDNVGVNNYDAAFTGCSKITNGDEIPSDWGWNELKLGDNQLKELLL